MLFWSLVPEPISFWKFKIAAISKPPNPRSTRRSNISAATTLATAGWLMESFLWVRIKAILFIVKTTVISNYCCTKTPKWTVSISRLFAPTLRVSSLVVTKARSWSSRELTSLRPPSPGLPLYPPWLQLAQRPPNHFCSNLLPPKSGAWT